ncbi:hypothetical protein ScPMuIL_013595 [Solemya velum]
MIARRRRTNSGSDSKPNGHVSVGQHWSTSSTSGASYPATYTDAEMTCRDRTAEYLSAVKSIQQSRHSNGSIPQKVSDGAQRSEFSRAAKTIGRNLANTFAKLEKLTILAKRKSLFDDKPVEIQELTHIIKQDMNSLNKDIAALQQLSRARMSKNGQQGQTHSTSVVVALQSKLATMSNDFKEVLEVRTENLKQQKSRREEFSQSNMTSAMPTAQFGDHRGSVLLQDEVNHSQAAANGHVQINMDAPDRYQQQMQLIDEQDSYIQGRAETMETIHSTIVELGSIFTQLAHMVKEQEEMVQRIDANVEDAEGNVAGAHQEILKYFSSVTSNRWLMIKIFGVLIIFFIIFVVFMA